MSSRLALLGTLLLTLAMRCPCLTAHRQEESSLAIAAEPAIAQAGYARASTAALALDRELSPELALALAPQQPLRLGPEPLPVGRAQSSRHKAAAGLEPAVVPVRALPHASNSATAGKEAIDTGDAAVQAALLDALAAGNGTWVEAGAWPRMTVEQSTNIVRIWCMGLLLVAFAFNGILTMSTHMALRSEDSKRQFRAGNFLWDLRHGVRGPQPWLDVKAKASCTSL